MLLLPHNVMLRDWFSGVVAKDVSLPLYVCPHQRYEFNAFEETAVGGGSGAGQSAQKHVPFVTLWFVGGLTDTLRKRMLAAWATCDRTEFATLAQTVEEMPRRIRKILKFAKRRVNKKARKGKRRQREKLR